MITFISRKLCLLLFFAMVENEIIGNQECENIDNGENDFTCEVERKCNPVVLKKTRHPVGYDKPNCSTGHNFVAEGETEVKHFLVLLNTPSVSRIKIL